MKRSIIKSIIILAALLSGAPAVAGESRNESYRCEVKMKGYTIRTIVSARSEQEAAFKARKRYPKGNVRYCWTD